MWCHVLLVGFPVAGLLLFSVLPFPLAASLYLPLAAASVGIGLVVVRALRAPPLTGLEAMPGRPGRVEAVIGAQTVQVRVGDELWTGVCREALSAGQPVQVVGSEGLTLIVRPADAPAAGAARAPGPPPPGAR